MSCVLAFKKIDVETGHSGKMDGCLLSFLFFSFFLALHRQVLTSNGLRDCSIRPRYEKRAA